VKNNLYFIGSFSNIYRRPSKNSEVTSQIIYGERFKIISKKKNWIRIKTLFDNYIGYIKNSEYVKNINPNYKVSKLKAKIYKKPNIRTKKWLTFGSKLEAIYENNKFIKIQKNKWIKKTDIQKIKQQEKNFVKIFKKFLGVKYVWGGKVYKGIDCSALLQMYFFYNNLFYPRDTKDQVKYSKGKLKIKEFTKGDIIFWKGHVAICLNSKKLIHAYGPKKKVLIMPIKDTIDLIQKTAKLYVKKVARI